MRPLLPLLSVLALGLLPGVAAASTAQVYEDCQDGRLDRAYPGATLRAALKDLPEDIDEYTNCREIIRSAQQGVNGPGGSGPTKDPATGQETYGPKGMGGGGLPVGADKRQVDPLGFATEDEKDAVRRARGGQDPDAPTSERAQDAAQAVPASSGRPPTPPTEAALPDAVVVLLVLTGIGILGLLARELRDPVVRRTA